MTTTVLAARTLAAVGLALHHVCQACKPALRVSSSGLRGQSSPVLLLKALSPVPRNLRGPHFALLLLLRLQVHTVNFLSNDPLSVANYHSVIFSSSPRLFLHEATMRLMAGAPPAKTQQLLERWFVNTIG